MLTASQYCLQAHLDNHAHVVTVLEAAQAAANASNGALEVSYSPGVKVQSVDTSGIQHAADTAKAADVAVVVVGDSAEAVGYDGSVRRPSSIAYYMQLSASESCLS